MFLVGRIRTLTNDSLFKDLSSFSDKLHLIFTSDSRDDRLLPGGELVVFRTVDLKVGTNKFPPTCTGYYRRRKTSNPC